MKKIFLLFILLAVLLYLIISKFALKIEWVNPNVNTNVLPYISKTIKKIDTAAKYAEFSTKGSKIIYQNGYGSGFVKNNPIPNDLDYAIGVNLGTFEYNGKNSKELAHLLNEKMVVFQISMYNYIYQAFPDEFFTNYSVLGTLQELYSNQNQNIKDIEYGIEKIFKHKDYIKYTDKILYDINNNEIRMMFPFVLKNNEILIENFSPIHIYTNSITYGKDTRQMLREISIVIDFYADIKYKKEIIRTEFVAESFSGQRLQLSRRFFVPVIFISSYKYLKNLAILNDDEKYIEYRMFNFKRHLQEFSNLSELQDRPVKLFKRVLQCTDLIKPALNEKTVNDITSTIESTLNNPKIKLINDYQTALTGLIQITSMPKMYLHAQSHGKISEHLKVMKQISKELNNKDIENYTDILIDQAKYINSPEKLKEFHKLTLNDEITDLLISGTKTNDTAKILGYINIFNNILKYSGFHKIDVCWLDKNLMGIAKDDFTSKIPEKELKNFAKQNNLADVEYKFINKQELSGPKVRYALWVRYNPTEQEEIFWNNVKTKLLQDKKHFNIKFKIFM